MRAPIGKPSPSRPAAKGKQPTGRFLKDDEEQKKTQLETVKETNTTVPDKSIDRLKKSLFTRRVGQKKA